MSERSQTQKSIYCMIHLYEVQEQVKFIYGVRTQNSG